MLGKRPVMGRRDDVTQRLARVPSTEADAAITKVVTLYPLTVYLHRLPGLSRAPW